MVSIFAIFRRISKNPKIETILEPCKECKNMERNSEIRVYSYAQRNRQDRGIEEYLRNNRDRLLSTETICGDSGRVIEKIVSQVQRKIRPKRRRLTVEEILKIFTPANVGRNMFQPNRPFVVDFEELGFLTCENAGEVVKLSTLLNAEGDDETEMVRLTTSSNLNLIALTALRQRGIPAAFGYIHNADSPTPIIIMQDGSVRTIFSNRERLLLEGNPDMELVTDEGIKILMMIENASNLAATILLRIIREEDFGESISYARWLGHLIAEARRSWPLGHGIRKEFEDRFIINILDPEENLTLSINEIMDEGESMILEPYMQGIRVAFRLSVGEGGCSQKTLKKARIYERLRQEMELHIHPIRGCLEIN